MRIVFCWCCYYDVLGLMGLCCCPRWDTVGKSLSRWKVLCNSSNRKGSWWYWENVKSSKTGCESWRIANGSFCHCVRLLIKWPASCSFILHWDIPCPSNISLMVVMNCIALSVVRARVLCWGAIWFPFILMCLWHQENCWDSRGKCLHLGLQPELQLFIFSNDYLFPNKKRYGLKMISILRFS